jgi:septal ring factor EnvC (AmiA/AmiB activator)
MRVRQFLLALALLAPLLSAAPLGAQQVDEIRQSQQRLEEIRRERTRLRQEMEKIRGRVHDLSSEVSNLERQVSTSADLLRELDFQITDTDRQIAETTRDLLTTQDHLAERTAILHRRLRDIYKRGPLHTAQVLLAAESFSDLLNRYKYLFLIARRDRALVSEVAALRNQLTMRERALERGMRDLHQLKDEKSTEFSQLQGLEEQRRRTLTSARSQERTTSRRIDQLAADERRITNLIATLERKRKEAERAAAAARLAAERAAAERAKSGAPARTPVAPAPAAPAAAKITRASAGSLPWPVNGRLLYRFGRAVQPNGTVLRWNGIGIQAPLGQPVRAVAAGTVVLASPFEGYGPTVVVDHGGGYYSLYLYLREISVKEGSAVTAGQAVGTVGGQETPHGPHLEFQLRAPGGEAVDPLVWLRAQDR